MKTNLLKYVLLFLLVSFLAHRAAAVTINIPADFETIQAGIDAANDADTVLVQPGIYYENIVIEEKSIVLGSLFMTTQDTSYISKTVIDGGQKGSVIRIILVENEPGEVNGFTLNNGYAIWGGGIYSAISKMNYCNLKIFNNTAQRGGGIAFNGFTNYMSTLVNAIIERNRIVKTEDNLENAGGIYCNMHRVNMKNVVVRNNAQDGVYLYQSGSDMKEVAIYDNTGSGVRMNDSSADMENVKISENDGSGISLDTHTRITFNNGLINGNGGDGIYAWVGKINLTEVNIKNNGGYGFHVTETDVTLKNVNISENKQFGFYNDGYSNNNLSDVTIRNNSIGLHCGYMTKAYLYKVQITENKEIGVTLEEADLNLINCTISENSGGIFSEGSYVNAVNTIIWKNQPYEVNMTNVLHYPSIAHIVNSNIKGGKSSIIIHDSSNDDLKRNSAIDLYENTIDADPMFVDSESNDYRLMKDSPCIDTGTRKFFLEYHKYSRLDFETDDYYGSAPDMGAHEYSEPSIVSENQNNNPSEFMLYQNYPNPFNQTTSIPFLLQQKSNVSIRIYNIMGSEISILTDKTFQAGLHNLVWDSTDFAAGLFFFRMEVRDKIQTGKMLLLK
ncbi:right-handed parallel beta-helix repeat-containing protein [Candidatus Latescibacterota bacterium]